MWCFQNLPSRSFTISPKRPRLSVRKTRTGRGGVLWWSFAAARLRAMELITILNRCHRFPGFVYQHAHLGADKKSIEVAVRPRKGSTAVCSRCHQPAPGYDQLAERRFEFIPLWGFFVFLLYAMRRVYCRRCNAVIVEEVPRPAGKCVRAAASNALTPVVHGTPRLFRVIVGRSRGGRVGQGVIFRLVLFYSVARG